MCIRDCSNSRRVSRLGTAAGIGHRIAERHHFRISPRRREGPGRRGFYAIADRSGGANNRHAPRGVDAGACERDRPDHDSAASRMACRMGRRVRRSHRSGHQSVTRTLSLRSANRKGVNASARSYLPEFWIARTRSQKRKCYLLCLYLLTSRGRAQRGVSPCWPRER